MILNGLFLVNERNKKTMIRKIVEMKDIKEASLKKEQSKHPLEFL